MITIIGDTSAELAVLQSVINTGILNVHDTSETIFNVKYKLSSGNPILTDTYGNIVGEKSKGCHNCKLRWMNRQKKVGDKEDAE